ncbi:hypothetical protein ACFQZE_03225 [Paenibacillus sp. GCM10027627]|uniref:hypothetical protein n=1 Tax=unclassified Paenibacillus TaxID=185978 RepID=UPI003633B148
MGAIIEVFVDGSLESNELIHKVRKIACHKCKIVVYDRNRTEDSEFAQRLKERGIELIPSVTLNGKVVPIEKLKL